MSTRDRMPSRIQSHYYLYNISETKWDRAIATINYKHEIKVPDSDCHLQIHDRKYSSANLGVGLPRGGPAIVPSNRRQHICIIIHSGLSVIKPMCSQRSMSRTSFMRGWMPTGLTLRRTEECFSLRSRTSASLCSSLGKMLRAAGPGSTDSK